MSARTRQTDLSGDTIREKPPTATVAVVLYWLPPQTAFPAIASWVRVAQENDTERVLRWIERATAEDVIHIQGGEE